jgi:hypothetical protein
MPISLPCPVYELQYHLHSLSVTQSLSATVPSHIMGLRTLHKPTYDMFLSYLSNHQPEAHDAKC